jgi:transposase-like protein
MISPMAGTIFEKSSTSLRLWFYAMYLMASTRCGISAKQIQRETGVTYKTAWRMFRQIRTLLSEEITLEGSSVEMDETYFGGKRKGYRGRPGAGDKKKSPIVGIAERRGGKGRVIAKATKSVNAETLTGMVKEYVLPESTVFTDDFSGYDRLKGHGFTHHRINHSAKVWVMGDIHTNTIEGFWSLVKRGIGGVYHQVSQKYLQSYLDEYTFRYNRRDQGNLIFTSILERVCGKAETLPVAVDHEMPVW